MRIAGRSTQIGAFAALSMLCTLRPQVGFMLRLEGGRLPAGLEEQLPDYQARAGEGLQLVCSTLLAAACLVAEQLACGSS